jgi:hypothetical protein
LGAPQEGAKTDSGAENSFAIAHACSGLTRSYTIDVAISMVGKLGQNTYIYFEEHEGKMERSSRRNIDQTIHNFNSIFFSKPAQAVKRPKAICDDFMNTFLEKISTKEPCF